MKKYAVMICLIMMYAIVNARPLYPPVKSRFAELDKTQADYERNVAALCVETLHDIRRHTFEAAALQQAIDAAQVLNKPVDAKQTDKLKLLNDNVRFDNADYAQNCI